MGIFKNFLKPRLSGKTALPQNDTAVPDDEYRLPRLSRADFVMTDELRRRQQVEQLCRKYGITVAKEGEFL